MKARTKLIWGIILVFFGIILLGESTGLFCAEQLMSSIAPVGLIVLGLWLILRRKAHTPPSSTGGNYAPPPPPPPTSEPYTDPGAQQQFTETTSEQQQDSSHSSRNYEQPHMSESPSTDDTGKLRYSKTFGDMYIDCNGVNLQNIEISAGVGDLELRLNGGVLGEGLNRLIISSFVGDIRITAPANMPIFAHCSNFVGDIELMGKRVSGFGNSIDSQTADYQSSPQKLYVACNSFIGDIKIYGI